MPETVPTLDSKLWLSPSPPQKNGTMPRSDLKRIFSAAEELGYPAPHLRGGGHYATTHPDTGHTVVFPATPSDYRAAANAVSTLQRQSGRRLKKQTGYRRGRSVPRLPATDRHFRTDAEELLDRQRAEIVEQITEIDDDIRDIIERIDLGRIPADIAARSKVSQLLSRRETCADSLRSRHGCAPNLDIPGLDALLSTASDAVPARESDLDRLRSRFTG